MPTRGGGMKQKDKGRLNFILWILIMLYVYENESL